MNAHWLCRECYRTLAKDAECFSMANSFHQPCINCGGIDEKANLVCSAEKYVKSLAVELETVDKTDVGVDP